mmetsp:Transcript_11170/g.24379  ORF Transcript_11170/g.24379 Transcript_11170/m.24379 type:complete len:245 (-) Transcript_11170:420-1154(-)
MRAAQIKAELKMRRIDFTDCFDKESLADKLMHARAGLASPAPAPAPATAPVPGPAVDEVPQSRSPGLESNFCDAPGEDFKKTRSAGVAPPSAPEVSPPAPTPAAAPATSTDGDMEPMMMRAAQIKAELKERRIDFTDCFDKESLADKLIQARAGLIRPATVPTPRGAAKGAFEFGAESRQGEDDTSLDDAFKAAGWTGEAPKDPSKVDEGRSPGLRRNFGDVPVSDFKKPYSSGGGEQKRGRYG